jgi:ribosomal protein L7/L12
MLYTDQQISELRQRVALLERQVAFLMAQLGVEYYEEPDTGVSPEILDLVRQGRKIQAIKLYRLETGVGLREAKEFVDSLG